MTTDNSIPQTRTTPLDPDLHKRYWLFSWQAYEANGGLSDFEDSFDTIEEAELRISSRTSTRNIEGSIFDSQDGVTASWFEFSEWKRVNRV